MYLITTVYPKLTTKPALIGSDSAYLNSQKGFTLLELIIAITIFAVLAVAGWQVFDSLNKSKERSDAQIQTLSQIQYAYQQIQRDMMQVVAYNLPKADNQTSNNEDNQPRNSFGLNNNVLTFVRYADPDPRYQEIPTLERIEYRFSEGALLRRRYSDVAVTMGDASVPFDSQILEGIEGGSIQVLLPEPSIIYPIEESLSGNRLSMNKSMGDGNNIQTIMPSIPKGVALSFNIQMGNQSTPLQWRFTLPAAPPDVSHAKSDGDK